MCKNRNMTTPLNYHKLLHAIGNWDWQPSALKKRFGQLTLFDVTLKFGHENDMVNRIARRLQRSEMDVIELLEKLQPSRI